MAQSKKKRKQQTNNMQISNARENVSPHHKINRNF